MAIKVRLKDASEQVLHPETDWSVVLNKPSIVSKTLSLNFQGGTVENMPEDLNTNFFGIAALPNETHPKRTFYSPDAEFMLDREVLNSPIGYSSNFESGVVFTANSPASKLCPAAVPFISDAYDDPTETFKAESPVNCEFGIHPVVLKLKLGTGPEFEGQLIAWVYGYQPRKEADRNSPVVLSTIMKNCIGTTIIQSSNDQSSSWSTVFNILITNVGSCTVNYYTGTSNMTKASKTYSAGQVISYQYYPFYYTLA